MFRVDVLCWRSVLTFYVDVLFFFLDFFFINIVFCSNHHRPILCDGCISRSLLQGQPLASSNSTSASFISLFMMPSQPSFSFLRLRTILKTTCCRLINKAYETPNTCVFYVEVQLDVLQVSCWIFALTFPSQDRHQKISPSYRFMSCYGTGIVCPWVKWRRSALWRLTPFLVTWTSVPAVYPPCFSSFSVRPSCTSAILSLAVKMALVIFKIFINTAYNWTHIT